jgi:hypothetical protein
MPIVIGNGITLGSGVIVTTPPPGSIQLGTSGSYIGTSGLTALGSSPGTYECWFYITSSVSVNSFLNTRTGGNTLSSGFVLYLQSNRYNIAAQTQVVANAGTVILNAWNHVAITFTSGTSDTSGHKLWVNGTSISTFSINVNQSTTQLYIGGIAYGGFIGYFTNFRYVRGVEVYTGTFTPPTSPLRATQSAGANISAITAGQTQLLLNTADSGSYLTDSSGYGRTITPTGNISFNSATPFS